MLENIKYQIFKKQYDEYIPLKNIFNPPKMHFFVCPWRKNHLLPVWRRNLLHLSHKYKAEYDVARLVKSEWNDDVKKRHPFLTKIFKPVYNLPLWLHFGIFSSSLGWKTKYSEYRFEWNPFWYINIFGISFGIILTAPNLKENSKYLSYNDDYWEALLTCHNIINTNTYWTFFQGEYPANNWDELKNILKILNDKMSIWTSYKDNTKFTYQGLRKDFFKNLSQVIFERFFEKEDIIENKK